MLVRIIEVHRLKEIKSWHQFSRDLYVNDDFYISHIDQDIDAIFDSGENSEFEFGDATRWIAIHNDNIVGRIAAFYSKKHQQSGLGFFDCINNQEVANALFDVGIKWLKEKGFNKIINENFDSSFSVSKIQTFSWFGDKPLNYDLNNLKKEFKIYIKLASFSSLKSTNF